MAGCDAQSLLNAATANGYDSLQMRDLFKALLQLECQETFTKASASFQRPNNSTSYNVSDSINATVPVVMKFANIVPNLGGAGIIRQVKLATDNGNGFPSAVRIYFFNKTLAPTADKSPLVLNFSDNAGWVTATTTAPLGAEAAGSGLFVSFNSVALPFVCDPADNALYAVLGYAGAGNTPVANQLIYIELTAELI